MEFSNRYTIIFAATVCLCCSLVVSALAVSLKDLQDLNKLLDKQKKIIEIAGIKTTKELKAMNAEEIGKTFDEGIEILMVDRTTGNPVQMTAEEITKYDLFKKAKDKATSTSAKTFDYSALAQVKRLPKTLKIYRIKKAGKEGYVFPIWGNGLWSTLKGFLCVENDCQTIRSISYYEHGETPGLGGEIDNPTWRAKWASKLIYKDGTVAIEVKKPLATNEYQVDSLSGATLTANGVTYMLRLWFGENGYLPFIKKLKGGQ